MIKDVFTLSTPLTPSEALVSCRLINQSFWLATQNIGIPSLTCLLFSAWVGDGNSSRMLESGDF